jgi:hypothetical protein
MKDKLANCAAQVVLRQRQTKSQIEHVKFRLVKNEEATAYLKSQLKMTEKDKLTIINKGKKERRQLDVDRQTMQAKLRDCEAQV